LDKEVVVFQNHHVKSSLDEHIFYCGFAEGDKMIFNLPERVDGKKIKRNRNY
jgi:hypothetical protein